MAITTERWVHVYLSNVVYVNNVVYVGYLTPFEINIV